MAKALKPGDHVTVKELLSFAAKSPAYRQGLTSVQPGQVGRVVGQGDGRSVIVDFKGIQAVISSQRLERASEPTPEPSQPSQRKRGKAAPAAEAPTPKTEAKPAAPASEPKRAAEPASQLVTTIANKVLLSGAMKAEPDTLIQLRLAELPGDIQQQVQTLIEAKLALNLQTAPQQPPRALQGGEPKAGQGRRGRKPKA